MFHRTTSADGTEIAYTSSGSGPPLVLVHGSANDHTRFTPLMVELEREVELHAMDRRGRGASGDAVRWSMVREFQDVAAVVEAVAAHAGRDVHVYGHSFGGTCALGASLFTDRIATLLLYEPPVRPPMDQFRGDPGMKMSGLLRIGKKEAALEVFLVEVAGYDEELLRAARSQASWKARVETAPTLTRELHGIPDWDFDPHTFADVEVPTIVFSGSASPAWMRKDAAEVANALPNGRLDELEGHAQTGDVLAPVEFAARLKAAIA